MYITVFLIWFDLRSSSGKKFSVKKKVKKNYLVSKRVDMFLEKQPKIKHIHSLSKNPFLVSECLQLTII